ncbi:hypothetical protein E2C01_085402 [Portunus trituberculatus]|uniref:Uncharacterized protein n=1 Tax=Portunus trituberculatus TaxID=210409 RepID=A0A5B7J6Q9_PORTR|nr:hypothetical protein [Portunus trituberculatus]
MATVFLVLKGLRMPGGFSSPTLAIRCQEEHNEKGEEEEEEGEEKEEEEEENMGSAKGISSDVECHLSERMPDRANVIALPGGKRGCQCRVWGDSANVTHLTSRGTLPLPLSRPRRPVLAALQGTLWPCGTRPDPQTHTLTAIHTHSPLSFSLPLSLSLSLSLSRLSPVLALLHPLALPLSPLPLPLPLSPLPSYSPLPPFILPLSLP